MHKIVAALLMLVMLVGMFIPSVSFTEDADTVLLARTIYALGKNESYETKLALGTVVMNRVENNWFEDDLGAVLTDQHQFPAGRRYDDESLQAAHDVLSGRRNLAGNALYYQHAGAENSWGSENRVARVGSYSFYSQNGNI